MGQLEPIITDEYEAVLAEAPASLMKKSQMQEDTMSDYQQYLNERDKLDFLIQKGFRINAVHEHLNGASVEFYHPGNKETATLLIGTANARKYFSNLLIKQNLGIK